MGVENFLARLQLGEICKKNKIWFWLMPYNTLHISISQTLFRQCSIYLPLITVYFHTFKCLFACLFAFLVVAFWVEMMF